MSYWENNGLSDEWYTPKYVFDALDIQFDTDAASPLDRTYCHVPAKEFITEDSLNKVWNGFTWCNPPFGGRNTIGLWLDKMNQHKNGIVLTPDRSSAPWWSKASKEADCILTVNHKIKFIKPDGTLGKSPSNGTTLFGYGPTAVYALGNAHNNKLGTLFFNVQKINK